ncbi:MAG: helix-turn-helix transcriptional regulator [Clostridiales bacterium]|nr:helix-turn-helix transcriptional regulator [Clostridiales bacterium]MDD6390175.1 helix-turn-helix transcriptional regulator [Bacillota bacterium]MDY5975739.1 helix-turn-helix transcriptional regulator [Anaerovoracaceae bacterium]
MRNIISKLRKDSGLTQADLGKAMGVSRQTIISLENGKYNPSIELAYKISHYFGKTIEEVFIFGEEK